MPYVSPGFLAGWRQETHWVSGAFWPEWGSCAACSKDLPGLGGQLSTRAHDITSAQETTRLDEPAARHLVHGAERGSVVDREHGAALSAHAPSRKAPNGWAAHGDQLVVS